MTERYLTITLQTNWKGALRAMAKTAQADKYQGEVLNFESPGQFFGQLSEKRWEIVRAAQGRGELSVRELSRAVERDVARRLVTHCRRPDGEIDRTPPHARQFVDGAPWGGRLQHHQPRHR